MNHSFLNWFDALRQYSTRPTDSSQLAVRLARFELLERRDLMTTVNMSPYDQLLLELINRARANPGAEAALYDIDLNADLAAGAISYDAKQPLAPNQMLQTAAGGHSEDMLANNFFSHTNLSGQSPSDRATNAGYPTWVGENISWGGTTGLVDQIQHVYQRHQNLFLSAGHRQNMLRPTYEEIGVGVRFGPYTYSNGVTYNASMVTENFGSPGIDPVLTGVVYTDAADASSNDDDFYSIGEQIGSGTITATNQSTGVSYTTEIGTSGGYSLPVLAGTYDVIATSGIDGTAYLVADVVVTTVNVKVDFETTTAANANHVPLLEPIGDVTLYYAQTDVSMSLSASDADGDTLTYTVMVENLAAHLDTTLGLTTTSSINENWGGLGEKWLAGNGNELYYLTPSGQLFQWAGGSLGNLSGSLIASLDSSYHQNIALLHSPSSGSSGVFASVNGTDLQVFTDAQFDSTMVVTITVSDGIDSDEVSFLMSKGNQFNRSLDQDLVLSADGDFRENWGGRQEKWLQGAGGLQYFITPDGQFFRHNGSSQNNLTGTFVAQFDANVYERPWLLYEADRYYQEIALDLHTDNRLENFPLDFWLPYQMPEDRLQALHDLHHTGGDGVSPTPLEYSVDQWMARDEQIPQSETTYRYAASLLDKIDPTFPHKSLETIEVGTQHRDLAIGEFAFGLVEEGSRIWQQAISGFLFH